MILEDMSGQVSAELILLLAGIIVIVLLVMTNYQNFLDEFAGEINNTEVNNLNNKIDDLKEII